MQTKIIHKPNPGLAATSDQHAETEFRIRHYGETDFITGLRAVAALMVVMIHTAAFSQYEAIGQNITLSGKYGVDIFFVISGFTIAKTYRDAPG